MLIMVAVQGYTGSLKAEKSEHAALSEGEVK